MITKKESLHRKLEIKNEASIEGINANPEIFKNLDLGGKYQEQIHTMFEMDHEQHVGINFPVCFETPDGININFHWDRRSPYSIEYDGRSFYLAHNGETLFNIEFQRRPDYYKLKTSDGEEMSHIGTYGWSGTVHVSYSNECALKDKGLDCLYCNINATKDAYAQKESIAWRHPDQIGETVAAAYEEGCDHVTITGGFVSERRELEYYFDVAQAIQDNTGIKDFNGTAVIGAPLDLSVIEKYKEAGYRTIGINIEIWDKNIFKAICPGKEKECGGWEHWVKALEEAVEIFGHGRVRSSLVSGIEPRQSILEGVEYLASKGVICFAFPWCPNPGSALEGHRTPEPSWHFDISKKVAAIFKKAGFTYNQLRDCYATPNTLSHDIFRFQDRLAAEGWE